MHYLTTYLIFLVTFSSPWLLDLQAFLTTENLIEIRHEKGFNRIGAILDQTSRPGKEAKVAIEIAIQEFKNETDHPSVLYLQNSRGKPIHAAIAAKQLIDEHNAKAILGAHTWEEASAKAEVINESDHDIPFFFRWLAQLPCKKHINGLFFIQPVSRQSTQMNAVAAILQSWSITQIFFVQSVSRQSTQMNAVAAILQSWSITQITLIYKTSHLASASAAIISYLSQAFRQTGGELL